MNNVVKRALLNSLITVFYIILVALFLNYFQNIIGNPNNVLMAIFMIMFFVFSAGLTGSLVFGTPIVWYLNSKKRDAVKVLLWTFTFIFLLLILAFIILVLFG